MPPRTPTPPLPPSMLVYPSKTADYLSITDSQLLERLSIAMPALTSIEKMRKALLNRNPDDINKSKLYYQELEIRDAYLNEQFERIGQKPKPGDEVVLADLKDNITLRLFQGCYANVPGQDTLYILDFVYTDDHYRYMRKPDNIRVFARPGGTSPGGELFTTHDAAKASGIASKYKGPRYMKVDYEAETTLVTEGAIIDVFQGDYPRVAVKVPISSHSKEQFVPLRIVNV